ncbi:MAG: hypothetical protein NDF55_08120 [archaeon GB-1867-005]|nr:hypothetical protein [Candidatus Culexmicrobium cathedralense]
MPKVKLKLLFSPLRSLISEDELTIEAKSFREVISKLTERYGGVVSNMFFTEDGGDHHFNYLIMDGRTYRVSELLDLKFNRDKVIYVWPALDGG